MTTKAVLKSLVIVLAVFVLLHFAYGLAHRLYNAPSEGDHTFTSGFESGDASLWTEKGAIHVCCEDSLEIVEAPVRRGRYAARFILRRSDPKVKGGKRAEIRMKAGSMGAEYWHAISIFLPPDWTDNQVLVTLAQWHVVPDKWLGETGRSPPFRLAVLDGQWRRGIGCEKDVRPGNFRTRTTESGKISW